jgi:hypothetical protein
LAENISMMPPPRIALLNSLSFFCLAFLVPIFSAQVPKQTVQDQTQDLLQRQISWDENRPDVKNPAGLQLRFFKTDETTASGKRLAHFRAYVSGTPENKKYALTIWKIGSDPHTLSGNVFVNAKGLLMLHKPRPEQEDSDFVGDDEFHLATEAARGEPVRYALASTDKALFISGMVVPFPIEDTNNGCRLEVRLALPDAYAVLIYADGLPSNAEIPFQLVSAGKQETRKFSVDAQGHAATTDFNFAGGEDRGSLRVTLSTTECSTAVEIPWGKGSYHPL